jgi:hypothetical protein
LHRVPNSFARRVNCLIRRAGKRSLLPNSWPPRSKCSKYWIRSTRANQVK